MKIINFEQGSEEWFSARCGLPTASCFKKIVTGKGVPSKSQKKYLYQLAGERITGTKEETYQNAAMTRGIEMEAEARSMFEMIKDVEVQQVGLCTTDDGLVGCSPDGLVGKESGIEIKCPSLAVHVEYLLKNKVPSEYYQQVHGSMFVSGRATWWFMSYYPGIKPLIIEVNKDHDFIKKLADELECFCAELDDITEALK